jgi:steroid 5-alpha reductase family enzyme
MVVFGLMTICNNREAVHRVPTIDAGRTNDNGNGKRLANTTEQQGLRKKTDRQLLIILFFHVILLAILSFPLSIDRLYLTITVNVSKTTSQAAFENFIFDLLLLFYIYLMEYHFIFIL